jgi:mannonate dehydratase
VANGALHCSRPTERDDASQRFHLFNVHFRNIRGGFLNSQETFIDDGDVDMLKAMRVYNEVGFSGMIMPDHVPRIDGDGRGLQAFAYTFGYIKALIAAVSAEDH